MERLACLEPGHQVADPVPVALVGAGVFGVLGVELGECPLDVRGPAAAVGEPGRQVVILGPGVLGGVDAGGLGHDLVGDALCLVPHRAPERFAPREAFAAILVPSIDTIPTLTIPAAAHSRSTWANTSANASWWRARNRAIVVWSGASWPHTTRNATWSRHSRSIRREERSPTA